MSGYGLQPHASYGVVNLGDVKLVFLTVSTLGFFPQFLAKRGQEGTNDSWPGRTCTRTQLGSLPPAATMPLPFSFH